MTFFFQIIPMTPFTRRLLFFPAVIFSTAVIGLNDIFPGTTYLADQTLPRGHLVFSGHPPGKVRALPDPTILASGQHFMDPCRGTAGDRHLFLQDRGLPGLTTQGRGPTATPILATAADGQQAEVLPFRDVGVCSQ